MLHMQFFVRFYGQLHRTKPELMESLKNAVGRAASAAGGDVEIWRKGLTAVFNEDRIGFWLNILIFLEKVHGTLEKTAPELFGYALVLGYDLAGTLSQKLSQSRDKKSNRTHTGIWCSEEVRDALEFFATFDRPLKANDALRGYGELREFRSFRSNSGAHSDPERIVHALSGHGNTLLAGSENSGKKDAIYNYCTGLLKAVPPLVVRFGAGGCGLICFADAFTPQIRAFIAGASSVRMLEELDGLHDLLFKERLREELSPYIKELSGRLFASLLAAYTAAVKTQAAHGVLILEDLHLADKDVPIIFREAYFSLDDRPLVLAVSDSAGGEMNDWQDVFSGILNCGPEDFSAGEETDSVQKESTPLDSIPKDLCEIAYNISLLGRYFPSYLFPLLFEEEGVNREMYFRAVGILTALDIAAPWDPRPRIPGSGSRVERIDEDRKEKVRSAVRNRILAWVVSGRLRPCFNLLRILGELGKRAGDDLVLRSIRTDVLNGTCDGIDEALKKKHFSSLVGAGNAPVLEYIYKTLRALSWDESEGIRKVFQRPVPPVTLNDGSPCYGGCQAQIQINLAAFYIGSRDNDSASEAVRKAMVFNRDLGKDAVPAYRFFSLVNLSRKSADDALEYISFALDQAEKTGQSEELFLACYYASSINFLYGNLSKAERLAIKAEEAAAASGQAEWGMRARFFRGRICFDTGKYKDALEVFESIAALKPGNAFPRFQTMSQTVQAWIFRTRNFLERFSSGPQRGVLSAMMDGSSLDGKVFEIEAAYLDSDYEKAAALAEDFLSSSEATKDNFLFTEQPDWRSGFSQCEHLLQPEKIPVAKLALVYRLAAQCALRPSGDAKTEILGSMQRFMRDELLPEMDPFDSFYFHAWYSMLLNFADPGNTDTAQTDINTVVSMALKRLQRRADRIDENGAKQAFLTLSRWNSALYLAAREYKLI